MRITIVGGFFLPVPPIYGGAMEKMWWRLARIYAQRGHHVTLISRQMNGWADDEMLDGIRLIRIRGFDHRSRLWQNLLLDGWWGLRVGKNLPESDILITNTVFLPTFIRSLRKRSGLLVVNLNRYPKGQLRWYKQVSRIQAASSMIAAAAIAEAPRLASVVRHIPNPVDCSLFETSPTYRKPDTPLTIGFMGRIHPEKGMLTLIAAASLMAQEGGLPDWRMVLRGPTEIAKGGGGSDFLDCMKAQAHVLLKKGLVQIAPALNEPVELARAYQALDIFCYPTEAATGEAHPVAVLEAMAAGLPVVATNLPCFADNLRSEENSLLVPLAQPRALASALSRLLRDADLRTALGTCARTTVRMLDDAIVADQHLLDYAHLLHADLNQ